MVVEPAKALTAAAQQLVGGQFGAGGVVRTNVIHAGDRRLTINAHDRNMLLDALVHQRSGGWPEVTITPETRN